MTAYHHLLLTKINSRPATVAVIGLGYVGLPLRLRFAQHPGGAGLALDPAKVAALNAGRAYIADWNVLWLPLLILLMILTAAGVGMGLSALAIQYRDVRHATQFGVTRISQKKTGSSTLNRGHSDQPPPSVETPG